MSGVVLAARARQEWCGVVLAARAPPGMSSGVVLAARVSARCFLLSVVSSDHREVYVIEH